MAAVPTSAGVGTMMLVDKGVEQVAVLPWNPEGVPLQH